MFTEDDYKQIILDSLYNSDVIDKDLYLKILHSLLKEPQRSEPYLS